MNFKTKFEFFNLSLFAPYMYITASVSNGIPFFFSFSSFNSFFRNKFSSYDFSEMTRIYCTVPIRRICPLKISFSNIARTIANFKHWFNNICNSFVQLPWNDNFPVSQMYFITKIKIWPLKSKKCNKIWTMRGSRKIWRAGAARGGADPGLPCKI